MLNQLPQSALRRRNQTEKTRAELLAGGQKQQRERDTNGYAEDERQGHIRTFPGF
jgi:hypothetical protein